MELAPGDKDHIYEYKERQITYPIAQSMGASRNCQKRK